MFSVYLCNALFLHPEYYDIVASQIEDLRWAALRIVEIKDPAMHEDEPVGELLLSVILYARNYKKLPDRKGALDYATEIESKGKSSGFGDLVKEELTRMDAEMKDARVEAPTDINVLINKAVETARRMWHIQNGRLYSNYVNGGKQIKDANGEKRESTPEDAITWMRKQFTKDLRRVSIQPSGDLVELGPEVEAEIDRMVSGDDSERVLTGFQCLDEQIYISKKRRPFIGIMGFANDGKTTVLLTMLYNMALRGKSVILFSKEHDAVELAICFAFIHSPSVGLRRQCW
jgi:hypothetical protein